MSEDTSYVVHYLQAENSDRLKLDETEISDSALSLLGYDVQRPLVESHRDFAERRWSHENVLRSRG